MAISTTAARRHEWKPVKRRSLLLYGTCQATHLAQILQAVPCVARRFQVCGVEDFADPVTGEYSVPPPEILETCECIYYQARPEGAPPDYLQRWIEQGKAHSFPILSCHPLWPAHIELHRLLMRSVDAAEAQRARRLVAEPGLPWGRFPYGDRVLLDLAAGEEDPYQVIERYLCLDLAERFDLDRLVERWRYEIQAADHGCDVPMAEVQWREWKSARHYWTINHPSNQLAGQILRKLLARSIGGVPETEIQATLPAHEFDHCITPIHPSVARHLGIQWYSPYSLHKWPGGPYGIRQWALEHVRYTRGLLASRAFETAPSL